MKIAVIIPAAGLGRRFAEAGGGDGGNGGNKIEMDLGGRPVFLRSVELFLKRAVVGQIILAVNPEGLSDFKFRWGDRLGFAGVEIVGGGTRERWETVMKALEAVGEGVTHVAIHDAARPLGSAGMIDRVFEAAGKYAAVIPGVPVNSTLKRVAELEEEGEGVEDALDAILGQGGKQEEVVKQVAGTVDRSGLVEAQTPQVFEVGLIRRAYARIGSGEVDPKGVTDDASLVEAMGERVVVVEGEAMNLKITRPGDLGLARMIVEQNSRKETSELGKKRLFGDEEE